MTKVIPVLSRFGAIGFDDLPLVLYQNLTQHLTHTRLVNQETVWELRRIKDVNEISFLKEAAKLTDIGAQTGMEFVAKGLKEYEVAAEIEYAMRKRGSEGIAFETVVASGPRSAHPHGASTSRVIEEGDVVVMDLGAVSSGYRCDITRTVIVGKPHPKQQRILQILMEAHEKAFQAIREGVNARAVDNLARKTIADYGFGEYFIHGLGHGVGLDIHEPPRLAPDSTDILAKGNVVTDEPGIYLPEFGARIEDTILVHEECGEKLTQAGYFVM